MASSKEQVRLPGLHGLRFFAAFSVFLGHLDQAKSWVGLRSYYFPPLASTTPANGVTLFFVLSGFLITYLLLKEKERTGTISISHFYTRRMLRIWPLYYLFVFLTFAVIPYISFLTYPILDMQVTHEYKRLLISYLLMSPHVALVLFGNPGAAGPLWSVGVEEYFYFVWPQLIKRFRLILPYLFLLIIFLPEYVSKNGSGFWRGFFHWGRFDCMAVGGLVAWLILNKKGWIKFLFFGPVQFVAYYFAIMNLRQDTHYESFDNLYYSAIFVTIIANIALNPNSIFKFENRFLRYMGEISYGFYVFQWLVNVITINTLLKLGITRIKSDNVKDLIVFVCAFSLLTAFSSASYFLWERRFLLLKRKYV